MTFKKESDFEEALIKILTSNGWESEILKYKTEQDLVDNWANILFQNNRGIDRLNNIPLTDGEMKQIIEQIINLRTPLKLNGFINGRTVSITRDNPEDKEHFGKEISLKIYDRNEIAGGSSRYQIAQQPQFTRKSKVLNDRRGDLMLLINGMPVIHIELKKSGIPLSQAYYQIEKYSNEGSFSNLFSLIQVFVAMTPEEAVYFANPGPDGKFNKDYYFHWADFNNEKIDNWKDVASSLLSIPMAHQLIGFYTVADDTDGILKVMRSYQYYAANAISDKVSKIHWNEENQYGGYIWHTTGSGKTMTSFKSAELIADSQDADKVIFLMDRIELGTQSLNEYRGFANVSEDVQETEDTGVLVTKLKSSDPANTLIVTSIQKMSNIKKDEAGLNDKDIELMQSKRIVFIIDEAHRSTFGEMLTTIKDTFPSAIFFGFTGTPIQKENQKKMNDTSTVFGNELHRYSIADGIRDKNVLGFDVYQVKTFRDNDLRKAVALEKAKAANEEEALSDEKKKKIFLNYMNASKVKMAGYDDEAKKLYIKGIEDYIPKSQYKTEEHKKKVVEDILNNWMVLSQNGKFHAIFATSSIPEAIEYYRLIKNSNPNLKVTALFDPNIDNNDRALYKEEGLVEIIDDYNKNYNQKFEMGSFKKFKKDIASRLAHKDQYKLVERTPEKEIDLLIVVDQMLTGFDSKWINTLYLDKVLEYENIIQAFSRTNRLFGPDKPFGTIKYYRKPNTMKRNIDLAIKLYSGDKPFGLFAHKLKDNLRKMNSIFEDIKAIFINAGIFDFEKLPSETSDCKKFALLFNELNEYLEAAKIQRFTFEKMEYVFEDGFEKSKIKMEFDERTYLILVQRYKELLQPGGEGGENLEDVPYDIEGYLTEIDTGIIDSEYMNNNFKKYMKLIKLEGASKASIEQVLTELHKSFASLSQEEQKYANIFLHDVESANIEVDENKTLRDYITEYQLHAQNDRIHQVADSFGLDEKLLREFMERRITDKNINEYGKFDELKKSVDKSKAKAYFEKLENITIPLFKINVKTDNFLRKFIISGGHDR